MTYRTIVVAGAGINGSPKACKVCNGKLISRPSPVTGRIWLECPTGHYSKSVKSLEDSERVRTQFGAGKKVQAWY